MLHHNLSAGSQLAALLLLGVPPGAACGSDQQTATDLDTRLPTPLFRQCDPRWGTTQMGTKGDGEQATICKEGCAMVRATRCFADQPFMQTTKMVQNAAGRRTARVSVSYYSDPRTIAVQTGSLRRCGRRMLAAQSCVAMALAAHNFMVPCPPSSCKPDPQTLNAYLQTHAGYHCDAGDCNNLVLTAPDQLTGGRMRLIGEWCAASEQCPHPAFRQSTTKLIPYRGSGKPIEAVILCARTGTSQT